MRLSNNLAPDAQPVGIDKSDKRRFLNMHDSRLTRDMINHYESRTRDHIGLVVSSAKHLLDKNPDILEGLMGQCCWHDSSKWKEPEIIDYVYITWKYKCNDDGIEFRIPGDVDTHRATWHHVRHNKHHPEYWDPNVTDRYINNENRDKPGEASVDGTSMDLLSLAEMVCDWHAMGLERGNTARSWADSNINNRWNFSDSQANYIYAFISDLEGTQ